MNKSVFNKQTFFWIWLWLTAGMAGVVAYNGWALLRGQCAWRDLACLPWWGGLLLSINLVAAAILCLLSLRHSKTGRQEHCPGCCFTAAPEWEFCPMCGARRTAESAHQPRRP